MLSLVSIIPAAMRSDADAVAEALGWGPDTHIIPLAPAGADAPTHYGCRAHASDTTPALLQSSAADLAAEGVDWSPLTFAEVDAVKDAFIVDVKPDGTKGHFHSFISSQSLVLWFDPSEV
jgi:hypothetical protein